MSDDLGDRMKDYERQETSRRFLPMIPVYARIDGKCFSNFTKGMNRPYDVNFINIMRDTTKFLVDETNAKIGYCQSDEINLCWMSDDPKSQIFFNGKIFKMTSILAAMATAKFTRLCQDNEDLKDRCDRVLPMFDARVCQFPNQMECSNMMLWRELDSTKNSISMAARSYFSHKELYNKTGSDMQEMLFQKYNINFNDYPSEFKRGSWFQRKKVLITLSKEELEVIPEKYRPIDNESVWRTKVIEIDMPRFSQVINRVGVIFNGEDPQECQEN